MFKKVVIVLVVLALIWAIPTTRMKFLGFMQPALNKMGPVGAKATEPMKKYTARTQIAGFLRGISAARQNGKETPTGRTFVRWLRANATTDRKELDPWGNTYWLQLENSTFTIGSNGPDGRRGSADDISKTTTL